MSRRKSVGYEGVLLEPMQLLEPRRGQDARLPVMLDQRQRAAKHAKAVNDVAERVEALFNHYGVAQGRWKTLALALAFDHVPGFGTLPRTRRATIETPWYLGRLFRFINAKRTERSQSVATICANLHKDSGFQRDFPELRKAKKERLQNLYSKASAAQGEDGFDDPPPSPMYLRFGAPYRPSE